ncbi:MAG: asparaginase [Pseudomonadota bacterium]
MGEVMLFFTGGTSGMVPLGGRPGVGPAHSFDRLMAELTAMLEGLTLRGVQWADLPSPHMTPELMFRLAKEVDGRLAEPGASGAVVVHGTDVMEETAFMHDLVVGSAKPVVFTGSMRFFGELGYDGLRNLLFGIKAAASPLLAGLGSVVLMADQIFAASETVKVHSTMIDPFEAPGLGPIGYAAEDGVHLMRGPARRIVLKPDRIVTNVDLIKCCPGMGARPIESSRSGGAAGLVVEGFGAGNVPPDIVPALLSLVEQGRPVVLCTRCLKGGVRPIYGYPGGAADLLSRGVISGGRLSGSKARIMLMAALGLTDDPDRVRAVFEADFC